MNTSNRILAALPPEQRAIQARCFHPTGTFIEFKKEEIERSLPERFEQITRMYPDRLAVVDRTCSLTYDQLNRAANRVARGVLAQSGVGPEPVALLLSQRVQLIVAMLGIAKAGKFYVPLDPTMPRTRINYMLEDSQARLVVVNTGGLALASQVTGPGTHLLDVDKIDDGWSGENLALSISPGSSAYLGYTSGSTGNPKGVIQTHRNLLYHIMTRTNSWHTCAEDRWSLLAFATGQMIKNVFSALLNGASLYPLDVKEEGIIHLADLLVHQRITMCHISVALFRNFVDTLNGDEKFPQLRMIRLASQTVNPADVDLYKKHFSPNCVLVNGLSSTETGESVNYFIDHSTAITTSTVPVGYPAQDTEVLIIGDDGRRLGCNQIGEIAIKNPYLSPGYWRSPGLTQARFVGDPQSGNELIYFTGDLGRKLADGCLEHLGRKDFLVKIRGYRVEVGEIESLLLGHPQVKDAVVIGLAESTGGQRLVAYLVPSSQTPPSVNALRSFLEEKLPDYMIPSSFLILDALPRLPSGKVNRRDLPAPGTSRPDLETPFAAPRTPVEQELVEIWAKVLGIDGVGIHDGFLELGGDSLLASRVISEVINTFHIQIPLRSLFESATVSEMSVLITQGQAARGKQEPIDRMLGDLENLSDEQAKRILHGTS